MELQIKEKKKLEWLKQGGSEEELERLGLNVKEMHKKAMEENIAYKEADMPESDALEDVTNVDESFVNESEVTDATNEVSVDGGTDPKVEIVEETEAEIQDDAPIASADTSNDEAETKSHNTESVIKALENTVTAALDAYHEAVVVPLLAQVKELEVANKSTSYGGLDFANDDLPVAALAATIKQRYVSNDEPSGTVVSDEEVNEKEIKQFSDINNSHPLAGL